MYCSCTEVIDLLDIVGMQKQSKREAKAKLNNINGER